MNRVNHTFSSIEQVTDQFLTTKNQKKPGKEFRDFVCRDIKRKTGIEVFKTCSNAFGKPKYQSDRRTE